MDGVARTQQTETKMSAKYIKVSDLQLNQLTEHGVLSSVIPASKGKVTLRFVGNHKTSNGFAQKTLSPAALIGAIV